VTQPSFGVDLDLVASVAPIMDQIGADVAEIERGLRSSPPAGDPAGDDVFGEHGLTGCWREFFGLWTAELRTTAGAAHQFGDQLRTAVARYRQVDGDTAQRFGSR
jgi:hypothetical protein